MLIFLFYTAKKEPEVKLTSKNPNAYRTLKTYIHGDLINKHTNLPLNQEKSCNEMLVIYLEMLNTEWGQINPKDNRRLNTIDL